MEDAEDLERGTLYCPKCKTVVEDPLVCGDCAAIICRRCGAPLEEIDNLGVG
ncbi:MAG TPA: hypothetical protein VMW54_05095 [Terriglobia bacterium]|nr:hypothetical protein [Terriglobia bacterium]